LALNRSGVYYRPAPENPLNLALMRLIDEAFMECPFLPIWVAQVREMF